MSHVRSGDLVKNWAEQRCMVTSKTGKKGGAREGGSQKTENSIDD